MQPYAATRPAGPEAVSAVAELTEPIANRGPEALQGAVESEADRRNPWRGYGPCYCMGCIGSSRCEHEDGADLCDYCESPDCLGDCWGEEYDDGEPMRPVETITVAGGVL
jgi:hypothetical protein